MSERRPTEPHWLVRPTTIRGLWIGGIAALVLTVLAEFVTHMHGPFGMDRFPGTHALFGFGACVVLVVGAKLLGVFLKRRDDFYAVDRDREEGAP